MPTPPERKPPTPQPSPSAPGEDVTLPPEPSASDTAAPAPRRDDGRLPAELPAPFGRYRLLRLLGEGGMGRVYLAHDPQLDRPVALKVPLFGPEDPPALLERFYREARAAATVLHANVCPVYDVGEVGGVPYLTMAFIEGRPLSQFAAQRPLTPRQSAFLVRKVALALAEAHRRGVIHRDLKPSNVMVNRSGEPVVMDFGLARRARGGDARLTQQGAFLGTQAYAPPEQVSGDPDQMGPASDVYSLGVILYELLAGRLPFEGDALLMISRVLLEEPPPPSKFRPGLDPQLEAICLKAMAKRPEQRHASMAAFAAALQDHLRGQATAAEPPPIPATEAIAAPAREGAGLRASEMGGLRSVAQLPERAPAPKAAPPRRRKGRRKRGVPGWAWAAGGVGLAAVLLPLLAWGLYRVVHHGASPHRAVATHTAGVPSRAQKGDGERLRLAGASSPSTAPARSSPAARKPLRVSGPRLLDWPGTHVLSVAFTPDGGHLLAGGDAAPYLRFYHVASGTALRQPFRGH